ncbi:VWA domain-containing protein [Polycladidibacter stylochi]|uniref:VWA domain-containing protein n=1 Tax=Polycladidibacter stylochi TaxID=1807766 RepID=UPI0008338E65|nr:VWA domain-containing protein [Pseudovibrio stylochi]
MLTFLSPWWLLCFPLPLAIYYFVPAFRQSDRAIRVPFFDRLLEATGQMARQASVVKRGTRLQEAFLIVSWSVLVVCLAQPAMLGNVVSERKSARDLMIAVDLSKSMNAVDFPDKIQGQKQERWLAVQRLLLKFSSLRAKDRLGLIAFGSGAYMQVPFTNDIQTWQLMLKGLDTEIAGPATAIGDAIGLGIRAFEKSNAQDKLLILATDGKDTASSLPPIEAAKVAQKFKVKVFTVAIGNPETKIENQELDLPTLEKVAEITGGDSFVALDSEALQKALAEINRISPSEYEESSFQPVTLLYPYILTAALAAYFFLWLVMSLQERRLERRIYD